jgi:ADP-Ribosyltransferase in polyvalent proteins
MTTTAYHGTNSRFDKFDQDKARIRNDLYGGGVAYFTDSLDIAKSYARTMSKKDGIPLVYEVSLNIRKTFDVNDTFTGAKLIEIMKGVDIETFARGARLINSGNRIQIKSQLRAGDISLTGEQVFRGLSNGMIQTAAARKKLMSLGYDSLRYNGGLMEIGAIKHNVYLIYKASDITIKQRYIIKSAKDKILQ